MKRISITIIIVVIILSIMPLTYVIASASCTGSNPTNCIASDAFNFIESIVTSLGKIVSLSDIFHFKENPVSILLGLFINGLTDRFNFVDQSVQISISSSLPNPFVTTVSTNVNNEVIAVDTVQNQIVTQLVLPIIYLLAVIIFANRLKIKEFPILLGISVFTFLGLIYIGVLPSWVIILPIIFGSVIMTLLATKWLGARGTAES